MNLVLGIVFFFGLALSFLFSGMESGMLSTNRLALRRRARQGDKSAASLMKPNRFFGPCSLVTHWPI